MCIEVAQSAVSRKGRKIDFAQHDALNRQLAKLGEEFVVALKRHRTQVFGTPLKTDGE